MLLFWNGPVCEQILVKMLIDRTAQIEIYRDSRYFLPGQIQHAANIHATFFCMKDMHDLYT